MFRFFKQKVICSWRPVKSLRSAGLEPLLATGLLEDPRRGLSVSIGEQNFRNAFYCCFYTYIFVAYNTIYLTHPCLFYNMYVMNVTSELVAYCIDFRCLQQVAYSPRYTDMPVASNLVRACHLLCLTKTIFTTQVISITQQQIYL